MPSNYVVRQGDCLSSIASRFGFKPQTIWDYPDNAELKQKRENGNILLAGDTIVIPDLRVREEARNTDARHTFKKLGTPEKLHLVIRDERDEPRAGLRYVLTVDGHTREGTTGDDGSVNESIDPGAKAGELRIFDNEIEEYYQLQLGHLDPLTEESGIRMRLTNLGIDCGDTDDSLRQAIMDFQRQRDLDVTGEVDDDTRGKLKEVYGS
jgi:hypothetical protein